MFKKLVVTGFILIFYKSKKKNKKEKALSASL